VPRRSSQTLMTKNDGRAYSRISLASSKSNWIRHCKTQSREPRVRCQDCVKSWHQPIRLRPDRGARPPSAARRRSSRPPTGSRTGGLNVCQFQVISVEFTHCVRSLRSEPPLVAGLHWGNPRPPSRLQGAPPVKSTTLCRLPLNSRRGGPLNVDAARVGSCHEGRC
jgi:hypothetical protein